jgi:hypothetical protein
MPENSPMRIFAFEFDAALDRYLRETVNPALPYGLRQRVATRLQEIEAHERIVKFSFQLAN